ncbi:unnamed protein product [Lactuca virosa]|uniref:Uncharacterized protein n=1 Tax=Lactuca virosa TaxID=75947 RepID=A0AAU9MLF6_9ASTR|nr:unnamed protein product [Lactuca virosa]
MTTRSSKMTERDFLFLRSSNLRRKNRASTRRSLFVPCGLLISEDFGGGVNAAGFDQISRVYGGLPPHHTIVLAYLCYWIEKSSIFIGLIGLFGVIKDEFN